MTLLLCLALQAAPEQIERWIQDLGAEQSDVRDAAQKKLLEAGPAANEGLARVAAATQDPEVRVRARTLVTQIADREEIRGTLDLRTVTLASGRYTLKEAVQALAAVGGAVTAPADKEDRTFELAWEGVPFGQAVEELCRAHGALIARRAADGGIVLRPGVPSIRPVAYAGPLRIEATTLTETRTTDFEEQRTFNASGTLTVSTLGEGGAPTGKAVVTVTEARLEDGTHLVVGGQQQGFGGGGIIHLRAMMNGGRGHGFQLIGTPRSASKLSAISGEAEVTVPLGSEELTFAAEDVGKERKVGDYRLTLTRLADGKASLTFTEASSAASAEDPNMAFVRAQQVMHGSIPDPVRAAVEQRLDAVGIVGIDEEGREQKLASEWKAPPRNTGIRIVNGRMVDPPVPTIELGWGGTLRQIRLRFKPRSATLKFPFTLRNVPLP